ncbi:MAG TPA: hypothetical protein VM165_23745 [Planctomycetaceae bacterium]|nr:hypothetical protein [Planctomycetaceae bacterium]
MKVGKIIDYFELCPEEFPRQRRGRQTGRKAISSPSPQQIREMCSAIQAEWSDDTRKEREAGNIPANERRTRCAVSDKVRHWTPPECRSHV